MSNFLRKQNHTCMDVKFDGSPRGTIATLSVDTFDGTSAGRQWFWMTVCPSKIISYWYGFA